MSTTILAFNEKAVHYLNNGLYGNAVENLRLALLEAKAMVMNFPSKHDANNTVIKGSDNMNGRKTLCVPIQPPMSSSTNCLCSYNNLFTIFDRAFSFNKQVTEDCDLSSLPSQTLMVILYNMGLSHHVQGLSKSFPSAGLSQALEFYCLALSILQVSEGMDPDKFLTEDQDINLLVMALFNNIGHIHSHLFDIKMIAKCQSYISELGAKVFYGPHSTFIDNDLSFFFTHVMIILPHEPIVAPAA